MGLFNRGNKTFEKETIAKFKSTYPEFNAQHEKNIKNAIKNGSLTEENRDNYIVEFGKGLAAVRMFHERFVDGAILESAMNGLANGEFTGLTPEQIIYNYEQYYKNQLLQEGKLHIYVPYVDDHVNSSIYFGSGSTVAGLNSLMGPTTKWKFDELLVNNNGFTFQSTGETVLYGHIASITVNRYDDAKVFKKLSKGAMVTVTLINTQNVIFRSPLTIGFETLINEILSNQVIEEESTEVIEESSSSNVDDLMKYAELYKQGLLTEEEFEQKKKELL